MSDVSILGPVYGKNAPDEWKVLIDKTGCWNPFRMESAWFAAVVDGKVVGVGALNENWRHDRAWLGPTYVDEAYRGRGIQRLLIKARLDHAGKNGIALVESAADTTNTPSLRNMLNAGFKVVRHNGEHDHLELLWSLK